MDRSQDSRDSLREFRRHQREICSLGEAVSMYQPFFGLDRRPFSATPDLNFYFPTDSLISTETTLKNCLESGQGIATLSAPAGMGKTAFCQHLATSFDDRFQVVFLGSANFPTRRSLLQAILFELGQPYSGMSEQELRLELIAGLRARTQQGQSVILIVDEAHLLSHRLLEELRTLTNEISGGESMLRLLICGQLSLDEKLAHPDLDALNQRISVQTYLESLTRQESTDYIIHRIQVAGGLFEEVFSPEAVDMIVQASDGMPRCINQLCDHSLLLSYVAENKPVDVDVVREALDDLKQLPLHWNEPMPMLAPLEQLRGEAALARGEDESVVVQFEVTDEANGVSVIESARLNDDEAGATGHITSGEYEIIDDNLIDEHQADGIHEFGATTESESAAFEFGADDDLEQAGHIEIKAFASDDQESAVVEMNELPHQSNRTTGDWEEEQIVDRYSQLDDQFERAGRRAFYSAHHSTNASNSQTVSDAGRDETTSQNTSKNDNESIVISDGSDQCEDSVIECEFEEEAASIPMNSIFDERQFKGEEEAFTVDTQSNLGVEQIAQLLSQLIGDDVSTNMTGSWDTQTLDYDSETTPVIQDAEDLSYSDELFQGFGSRASNNDSVSTDTIDEADLARLVMQLVEEGQAELSGRFTPDASGLSKDSGEESIPLTEDAWFGSHDLFSDLEESDPFDDTSAFQSAKKFDIVQPVDERSASAAQKKPLFPRATDDCIQQLESAMTHDSEDSQTRDEINISPRTFMRLFSELRRRRQRSA